MPNLSFSIESSQQSSRVPPERRSLSRDFLRRPRRTFPRQRFHRRRSEMENRRCTVLCLCPLRAHLEDRRLSEEVEKRGVLSDLKILEDKATKVRRSASLPAVGEANVDVYCKSYECVMAQPQRTPSFSESLESFFFWLVRIKIRSQKAHR